MYYLMSSWKLGGGSVGGDISCVRSPEVLLWLRKEVFYQHYTSTWLCGHTWSLMVIYLVHSDSEIPHRVKEESATKRSSISAPCQSI